MKKALWILALALPACGQNIEHQIIASQYGVWRVQGYSPDTYSFAPDACQLAAGNKNFLAFTAGTPITIVDGNPALTEIVTPSLAIVNNTTCTLSIAPANHHQSPFYLASGTGGLQESLNANLQSPSINTIVLDTFWRQSVGATASSVIAAAQGNYQLGLVDITTLPYTWYQWNGAQYVPVSIGGVNSVFGRVGNVVAVPGDYNCYQVTNCGAAPGFTNSLAAGQTSSATTISLNFSVAGYPVHGTFFVDGEYETYTGLGSNQLTGITRGVSLTTPAAHGSGANLVSVDLAFGDLQTQLPLGGVFGGPLGGGYPMFLAVNCGTPAQSNDAGALTVIQANCGSSATWIDSVGRIHQAATGSISNFLSPMYIGSPFSSDTTAGQEQPILIGNSTNVVQTSGSYQFGSPMGFSAPLYGAINALPVPNIPAPNLFAPTGGACTVTYEIVGTDVDGATIPGTTAVAASMPVPGSGGAVGIQVPLIAGVVSYTPYRSAVSGCGGLAIGRFAGTFTSQYLYLVDNGQTGDGTTPPSTNTSVAKSCVGTAANRELLCTLAGSTTTPPLSCNATANNGNPTYGWDFVNVAATASPSHYHCYSGASSWTAGPY